MKAISVVDVTLRENATLANMAMSFKEKLEIAKQMDKLKVDVIELPPMGDTASDGLFVRTIASTLKTAVTSCPVGLTKDEADRAWAAISGAVKPRIHVMAPTSIVQMEYSCRMKPEKLLEAVREQVQYCASICPDVEFSAEDATRSDIVFLCSTIKAAIEAGAKTITICDSASAMLPQEFSTLMQEIRERVPEVQNICLSVQCGNDLKMAAANSFAAIEHGVTQIKTAMISNHSTSLETITRAIQLKGVEMGLSCNVKNTELHRAISKMSWIATEKSPTSPFDSGVESEPVVSVSLDSSADIKSVSNIISRMGYDLSDDDISKVYDAFCRIADKKQGVGAKEIEAIIASTALQAPPTYRLISYVVNSGNLMSATSHIVIEKNGEQIQGVCIGDGPIDASFLAVEQIVGRHYELDDFQVQAVTEGREAMGDSLVKLRANGKLYSGKGISTDIIGASIHAYVNALNKIAYEESSI